MVIDGDKIDDDHRHLIEIINQFEYDAEHGSTGESVADALHALRYYTKIHFRREEELQRVSSYPYYDAHKHEHADLMKKLHKVEKEAASSAASLQKQALVDIIQLLRSWLLEHILQSDMRMKPYVEAMQSHAKKLKDINDCGDEDDIWEVDAN